jgi:hypothetical protein
LADGPHTVRALQNGAEFARATFVVATLGLGEFPTGLSGAYRLPNFPQTGRNTLIGWQQSVQNFVITGAPPPGVDMNLCTTQTGIAVDPSGGSASLNSTNPCLAAGKTLLLQLQTLLANAQEAVLPQTATRGQGEPQSFLADAASLTFVQGNRTFTSTDFRWLDSSGNAVVGRTLPPGTTLDTTLTVNPESSLSFNSAFSLLYNNQTVVDFPPRPATTVDITGEGTVTASSTFGGNQFPPQRAIDGLQSTSWFSAGPDSSGSTVFTWTGRQDDLISSIVIFSNALNENPSFRTNFGFGAVTVQVLSASGGVIFEQSISLPGTPDPNIQVAPNVVGRSVRLIFSGHEDPGCGGFAELQIMAIR